MRVKATDVDSMYTSNEKIHYIIKGEENNKLFTINREKGQLSIWQMIKDYL